MNFADLLLFLGGLAVGSFLNVIALRYKPERPLFSRGILRGRSHCPHCGKTLRWFELIPLVSFIIQCGKCRSCHARLPLQYLAAELGTGLMFLLMPRPDYFIAGLFIVAAAILILIALIDLRLRIIPDTLNIALLILGIVIAWVLAARVAFGPLEGSFLGHYSLLFGLRESIWVNRLVAALAGGGFFAAIVFLTKGRGMGMGDVKLAAALGVLLGWPDAIFALLFSFIIGSLLSLPRLLRGTLHMKSAVPFGPYVVLGAFVVMLWGYDILKGYFGLFS